jgi:hypothetical protein
MGFAAVERLVRDDAEALTGDELVEHAPRLADDFRADAFAGDDHHLLQIAHGRSCRVEDPSFYSAGD